MGASSSPFHVPRPTPLNEETTMTETTRPQRIFISTDLSARCDRALARAALLGSTAERLLHTLDCDTLVVRGG